MKAAWLVGALLLALGTSSAVEANDEVYGTWQLLSWSRQILDTGETESVFGEAPHGFLHYGRDGRMLAMIVQKNREKPADPANMPDRERAELFNTMLAYGGTFTIDGGRVTHHVDISWNQSWTGTAQVRNFQVEGRKLTITVDPQVGFDGRRSTAVLTWEKVH